MTDQGKPKRKRKEVWSDNIRFAILSGFTCLAWTIYILTDSRFMTIEKYFFALLGFIGVFLSIKVIFEELERKDK